MNKNPHHRLLALGLAGLLGLSGCKELDEIQAVTIDTVDLSQVKDGDYEAFLDYKLVTAGVKVSVQGGTITHLQLLKHDHGPGHGADDLLPRILDHQSLAVDGVSGASASSKVVLKAVETALKKGL